MCQDDVMTDKSLQRKLFIMNVEDNYQEAPSRLPLNSSSWSQPGSHSKVFWLLVWNSTTPSHSDLPELKSLTSLEQLGVIIDVCEGLV